MTQLTTNSADDFTVRLAQSQDMETVWNLLRQFATSYAPDADCFRAQFQTLLVAPYARFLVADREDRVVGYTLAFHLPTLYANGAVCEIQELMVDPAYRNKGIGRTLVQALLADAKQSGVREVTVPTRRAGDYYLKLGFEATASYFKLRLN